MYQSVFLGGNSISSWWDKTILNSFFYLNSTSRKGRFLMGEILYKLCEVTIKIFFSK